MRILEIHKFHKMGGGADKAFLDNINLFREKEHEVIVFSMKHPKNLPSEYEEFFVDVKDYHSKNPFHKIKSSLSSIYSSEARDKLNKLIKKYKPDIAHIHNYMYQLTPSILYALKENNIPIVNTLHDYYPLCTGYRFYNDKEKRICEDCKGGKYYKAFTNRCMKSSAAVSFLGALNFYYWKNKKAFDLIDVFISHSQFLKDKMIEQGYPENKIKVINNFIDPGEEPDYVKENFILYAGVFLAEKGVQVLIEAYKKLDTDTELYLAGSGPYENELKKMAAGFEDKIKFLGFLPQDELKKYVSKAECVVVPSICYENFPYSVLEACTWGSLVVGSRIGGIPEIIEDGKTGLLFEPGNTEELSQKLNYLLGNPEGISEMSRQSRKKIMDLCDKDTCYRKMYSIFDNIIEK
jgi:glycosyltransferase involved in cell wall biosynthesis